MKRIPLLLLIPILLVGCITTAPEPITDETTLPTEEEALETILVAVEETPPIEYTNTLFTSEEEILPSPHDEWLEAKELWEEMEMEKAEAFPGYEMQPYPIADPDLIEETVEETVEEEIIQEVAPIVAEESSQERQKPMVVAGTEVPDVFLYICTVLILAILVTLCYIAKQRKERYWYMRRG